MEVRFGVNLSTSTQAEQQPVEAARRAEALGFDFVSCSDHLHGSQPTFETWTLLTWVAAHTTRLGVVTNVLGLPYRAPAVVAKMAEGLQRLSGGRFTLGLGAGGSDEEFRAFGLAVHSPGEKVDALEEALGIIRGLWTQDGFSVHGQHYRVKEAELNPKPERPIPIWLGVYGERTLALAGRLADGWLPSLPFAKPDRVPAMRDRLLRAAEEAGRDPSELTLAYNVPVRVGGDPQKSDRVVAGTPEQMAERLRGLVDLGFTALNFWVAGTGEAEQWERLAEVVPLLR